MSWFQRLGRSPREDGPRRGPRKDPSRNAVRRASPGLAAFFDGVREGGDHAILDMGPAAGAHLTLFSSFAGQVFFGDLLPEPPRGTALRAALDAIPAHGRLPYDLVLLWNLFDRVTEDERAAVVEKVTELSAPGARLFTVLESSQEPTTRPLRFTLDDRTTVEEEPAGPDELAGPRLLPAEVERVLGPWEVVRAFTVRNGRREYVAVLEES